MKLEKIEQQNNTFNWKKVIGPCVIVLIGIISYLWGEYELNYIEKNGVWSIMTVDRVRAAHRGTSYKCHYKFRDKVYNNTGGGVNYSDEGKRFFLQIIPADPERVRYYSRFPVPSWFTLDAPSEGWSSRPTEAELRKLQNEADSIQNIKSK